MKKLIIKELPIMPDAVTSHRLTFIQLAMQKTTSPIG